VRVFRIADVERYAADRATKHGRRSGEQPR
jgi:hypothetical protein